MENKFERQLSTINWTLKQKGKSCRLFILRVKRTPAWLVRRRMSATASSGSQNGSATTSRSSSSLACACVCTVPPDQRVIVVFAKYMCPRRADKDVKVVSVGLHQTVHFVPYAL